MIIVTYRVFKHISSYSLIYQFFSYIALSCMKYLYLLEEFDCSDKFSDEQTSPLNLNTINAFQ